MHSDETIVPGGEGNAAGRPAGGIEQAGDEVGPYKLVSAIGEGGFGTVWLAERRRPFTQRVALKIIKPGMDSKAVVARFEQERQALAVMNHPGIAKVLDGGLTPSGRPYFAMEYVKGEPITDFCDRVKLGIEERLQLFEQACEAIQHAHLKGVVHRDLKPANVLAFMVEGEGPKLQVIDFGVAKAMSQRMTEHTVFTETGQMIGTPEYMSPEQANPTAGDIDTRSDIYSLGVLLYELLVGATPFDGKELRKKAYGEIQRTIREQDPPSPSARLSTISTNDRDALSRIESARKLRAADLVRRLRGELEWIPQKAMRKEPQHRYQTAMALAEDVRAYLDGRPIAAAPESTAYRVRKYVRRNRALVAGAGAVIATLVVGLGLATWQWAEARAAKDQAITARDEAVTAKDAAVVSEQRSLAEKSAADAARAAADVAKAAAEDSEARATKQLERSQDLLGVISMSSALDAVRKNDVGAARRELATVNDLGRGDRFAARLAAAMSDASITEPLRGHEGDVSSVCFSPDGKTLASGGDDNTIRLWDASTGKPLGEPLRGHESWVTSVCFSPDGKTLASGSEDNTIRLWDASTSKPLGEPLRRHEGDVSSVCFSPDGKTLASGSLDTTIRLWDATTGKPISEPLRGHGYRVTSVCFSPDGKTLASGSLDTTIRLWDATTGKPISEPLRGHGYRVTSVCFSPDGKTLASGSLDTTIRLWDATTGKPIGEPLRGHEGDVSSVCFSPDGKTLASGSDDTTIRLWDASTGKPLGEPLRGHEGYAFSVCFSPNGKSLASGGEDKTIRLWEVSMGNPRGEPLHGHESLVFSVCFSPDGNTLASGGEDKTIRLWDAPTGKPLGKPLRGHEGPVASVCFSADGKTLASGSGDETICLWDASTGKPLGEPLREHEGVVFSVCFSPDGKTLASGSSDKTIRLWDASTGKPRGEPLRGHEGPVNSVCFSPDGKTLASGGEDKTIRLWDASTGKPLGEPLRGHEGPVNSVCFSPDGKTLESGGEDKTIRLWDASTGKPRGERLRGHEGEVQSVCFSPDGKTLASGSWDKTIRLWDASTGKPLGEPLRGHEGYAFSVCFSPNGKTLAIGSETTILLWHAVPMRERIGPIRDTMAKVDQVRASVADQIAAVGDTEIDCERFAQSVLNDPRFVGDLRRAALIVVGEVDLNRQAIRSRLARERAVRLQPLKDAVDATDWPKVIAATAQLSPEDFATLPGSTLNQIAWRGLNEVPADSPARDLRTLLRFAERAAELTERADGSILDTLARAHWELGDKPKALEVQAEAVRAQEAQVAATTDAQQRESLATTLQKLRDTLARYEREQPPAK